MGCCSCAKVWGRQRSAGRGFCFAGACVAAMARWGRLRCARLWLPAPHSAGPGDAGVPLPEASGGAGGRVGEAAAADAGGWAVLARATCSLHRVWLALRSEAEAWRAAGVCWAVVHCMRSGQRDASLEHHTPLLTLTQPPHKTRRPGPPGQLAELPVHVAVPGAHLLQPRHPGADARGGRQVPAGKRMGGDGSGCGRWRIGIWGWQWGRGNAG